MLSSVSLARMGIRQLEEAILSVLFQEDGLKQAEISERLHIPPTDIGDSYGIVGGILGLLREDGYVVKKGNISWCLTKEGRSLLTFFVGGLK